LVQIDELKNTAVRLKLRVNDEHTQWWEPAARLGQQPQRHLIAGAHAEVQDGNARVTATRLVAAGVLAFAMKKGSCYILITQSDGQETVIERKLKQSGLARKFAAAFNNAALAARSESQAQRPSQDLAPGQW